LQFYAENEEEFYFIIPDSFQTEIFDLMEVRVVTFNTSERLILDFELERYFIFNQPFNMLSTMKKFLFSTVLILAFCFVSVGQEVVTKGESNSAFGDYKIVKLEDRLIYNNKELDKYMITYEKSDMKVMVALDKQKKCKKYYVLSDKIPVQYECNGTIFGVKKLDKALCSQGYITSLDNLNREEFYHQKVLISGVTNTIDQLNLIASYYPGLYI
jgi:hypothetical protein